MNDINVVTATPQHIDLNQSPDATKTARTRQEESNARKQDFYKQLEQAKQAESGIQPPEPVQVEQVEQPEPVSYEPSSDVNEPEFESDTSDDDVGNSNYIPKKRFDKQIEKTKLAEEKYEREREARIKFETELQLYNKALADMQAKQQESYAEPEVDPIDSEAHNLYMKKMREFEEKLERQNSSLNEYTVAQQFNTTVNYQATEFKQKNPDYIDAVQHLFNIKAQEAKTLGASDEQAREYADNQTRTIAWQAFNQGRNAAEVAYNLAKAYGYKAKSSSGKVNDTPDLEKIEKNMQKSHSIINEVKGVSAKLTPDYAALATKEGFQAKLAGKNGRGTDVAKFHEALQNLKRSASGNYGN